MTAVDEHQVELDGRVLARIVGDLPRALEPLKADRELVISRFAWIRRDGEELIAETALGAAAVVLEDPRVQLLLAALATPHAIGAVVERVGLPLETVLELGSLLRGASVLIDPTCAQGEDEPPLALWEFHDLLFHARSRAGRSRGRSGGTYRFLDRFGPPPALAPSRWTQSVALERPDFDALEASDPPLSAVQSKRSSIRHYGRQPITVAQLGEFLYRVGRVEDYWETPIPGPAPNRMSFVARPYPSAGASYELELYAAVRACTGLERDLYRYDPGNHSLERAGAGATAVDELLARAAAGMGTFAEAMQVLIVITARVGRVAWKYESLAYELILKDVGVLLQTMYLAATAMGLAPCAIGTGDSDLFATATGINYYEESAVGELALGSRRAGVLPSG